MHLAGWRGLQIFFTALSVDKLDSSLPVAITMHRRAKMEGIATELATAQKIDTFVARLALRS